MMTLRVTLTLMMMTGIKSSQSSMFDVHHSYLSQKESNKAYVLFGRENELVTFSCLGMCQNTMEISAE